MNYTFMAVPRAFGESFIFDLRTPKVPAALLGYVFLNFQSRYPVPPTFPDPSVDLRLAEIWSGYYYSRLPCQAKVYGTNENPETVDLATCDLLYTLDEDHTQDYWYSSSWCKNTDDFSGSGKNYRNANDSEFNAAEPIVLRMVCNYTGATYRYLILVVTDTYNSSRWNEDYEENAEQYITFDEIEVLVKAE